MTGDYNRANENGAIGPSVSSTRAHIAARNNRFILNTRNEKRETVNRASRELNDRGRRVNFFSVFAVSDNREIITTVPTPNNRV